MSMVNPKMSNTSTPRGAQSFDPSTLEESKVLLMQVESIGGIGYWELDLTTGKNKWSDQFFHILGLDPTKIKASTELGLSTIHPEDLERATSHYQNSIETGASYKMEKRIVRPSGEVRFVISEGVVYLNEEGKPIRLFGIFKDITEEKNKELELHKKTRLIAAISHIIHSFLETEDWQELINPTLQLMGESADADRVYFFKNFKDPITGKLFTQQINKWTNGLVNSELDNPDYQAIPLDDHPITYQTILKKKPLIVVTKDAEVTLRQILEAQEIKSALIMPIFVDEYFYGFMGFDDCTKSKTWSDDEISFLASVSTNLSLAIERKQNLDKIRAAYESRDSILESVGDSFYALDVNYVVTYWNNVVEKLTGISSDKILGKNILKVLEKVSDKFKKGYRKAFEENHPQYFETYDLWLKAWLEVSVYPSNEGLSVIVKDISDRKKIENQLVISNERFAIISEASNDAIWDWNIETDEHFWGEGYQKLFEIDYKLERKSPKFWENRVHPEDLRPIIENLHRVLESKNENYFEIEYRFRKQDNTYAYVIDKGSIIRNNEGKPIRMVGAMQDISNRKLYEDSLQRLNTELAESNHELALSNKELEQFAHVASHDLQEPLRMISSFLGLIERRYSNVLDQKGHQYIHFAVNGALRMKEIILDLLDFSRIGNALSTKKTFKTEDIINEVLLLNDKLINEKEATIHRGPLPDIICHVNPIIQLFQNLIINGIKYQAKGNKPEIWIEGHDLGTEWKFSLRDNGIGIDPEFHDKIFIIFQRLHQKDQYSGTGIGLAICKKIVDLHGGKIWFESTPGKGSIFYFTLKK